MRIFFAILLFFTFSVEPSYADPGKGKGTGSEKGKGKGKGKNKYAKGEEQHEAAVSTLSSIIASDTGGTATNYISYASSLADTLGQFEEATLAEILGEHYAKLP